MQLVELLEVPQLVDACSRNGFYDEALELATFVNGLERKHVLASEVRVGASDRSGNDVVQSIVDDVHKILVELRRHLLKQLTEETTLPNLLQTLGVLRKLDCILIDRQLESEKHSSMRNLQLSEEAFDQMRSNLLKRIETTLQMNFLEARSVWMERSMREVLSGISIHNRLTRLGDSSDGSLRHEPNARVTNEQLLGPYGRGIELLEVCRSSWHAIVTQYNALFAESNGEYSSHNLLSFWLENQLKILQHEVKSLLVKIDEGPSIRSLIEQCYSFADRMGQVGCDFSRLITPVFEDVLHKRIKNTWNRGLSSFFHMVDHGKIMVEDEDGLVEHSVPLYLRQDADDSHNKGGSENTAKPTGEMSSPDLMSYPPLAYLLNSFLTGLNFLKGCPLLSLRDRLITQLEEIFGELCMYVVRKREFIATNGKKHMLASSSMSSDDPKGHTNEMCGKNMDKVYGALIVDEVITRCLDCMKVMYLPFNSMQNTTSKVSDNSDKYFISKIKEVDEGCRKLMSEGNLI